jgi:chitinase
VGSFKPPNIDPALCSHIIYAFAVMDESYRVVAFEWNDDGPGNLYEQLNNWKFQYPNLKTLIAVGGWNFGMDIPSRMLATQANRAVFINSAIQFCRQRNFDGFDLDFEYPGGRGSPPEDRERFTMLVRELRIAFDNEVPPLGKPKLLLTAAVGAGKATVDAGYEIDKISQDLDMVNLMAYDFFGAWDPYTGLNAPLYHRTEQIGDGTDDQFWNTAWAAEYWVSRGCPREKLMIGLATYGRCFTLTSSAENGLPAPAVGPCKNGTWTREAGFLSYYEICQLISVPGSVTVYHEEHRAPYTYVGDQWVGYDNEQSLVEKVEFINSMGYGGWMAWNIDLDDFTGSFCGKGQYPLMRAINNALLCSAPGSTVSTGPTTPPPVTQSTSTPTSITPTTTTTSVSTTSSSTASTTTEIPERYKRVCYVSNWAQYRPGDGKFTPKDINAALCTHIIYAFAVLTSGNNLVAYEWNDDVLYAELQAHKAYNPKLKTLIAVGGWNFGMTQVTLMMSSAVNRQQFITSSIQFCRFYGFDGLDLDFEYPGFDTSPPEDKQRFTSLVQELREAFDAEAQQSGRPKLLLTCGSCR